MSYSPPTTTPTLSAEHPAVIAHINLLQGVINRLANNSASCKTWCLTLVGALVSLAGATHVPAIITFALVPIIIFGLLDSMYLAQERAYRKLYGRIVGKIRDRSYSLSDAFDARAPLNIGSVLRAVGSWSIYPVYLGLIAVFLLAYFKGWLAVIGTVSK